jgi:glycosyltransferase involved in cell wall biosynthesis
MERAVKSIADQTYRKIEIIALLPGSDRIAREAIEAVLAATDLPYFLVPVTSDRVNDALGAGLAAATGEYASYLKGDMYSQTRIEHMLRTLEATGALWGFSNVAFSSAEGNPLAFGVDPVVDAVMRLYDSLYTRHQILESLLEHDQIQFLGNIFARRAAWLDISKSLSGHEREYCWALSFQLGLLSEPAYLDAPGYIHVVGTRTDADSGGPSATSLEMLMAWHRQATQEARQIEVRQRYWQHVLSKLGSQPLSQGQLMDYAAQLGFTS